MDGLPYGRTDGSQVLRSRHNITVIASFYRGATHRPASAALLRIRLPPTVKIQPSTYLGGFSGRNGKTQHADRSRQVPPYQTGETAIDSR